MSEYISFFVRHKDNDTIIELTTYCRSSYMFQAFQDVPHEKIKAITVEDLKNSRDYLRGVKKEHKAIVKEFETKINMLTSMPILSVEDAMQILENYTTIINESKEEIRQIRYFIHIIGFLEEILEQKENILYVGKEVYKPTVWDITPEGGAK